MPSRRTSPKSRLRPDGIGMPRRTAFLVMAAFGVLVAWHGLGFSLLAGLFSYTVLDLAHRRLSAVMRPLPARWLTFAVFLLVAALAGNYAVKLFRQSITTVPAIVEKALPRVTELADRWDLSLPFGNMDELREVLLEAVRTNAGRITLAGGLMTIEAFSIIVAGVIAVLCFMAPGHEPSRGSLYDALRFETAERIRRFMDSFERVLGAQVVISAINTALTAVFLISLEFPYTPFLIPATFVVGLFPVIGNLVSNTLIVGTALTLSVRHALLSLGFIVAIHKGEYFLNSRIIGASIHAPMWQTLLGILIGEMLLGIPGIILAPAVIHYLRLELSDITPGRMS